MRQHDDRKDEEGEELEVVEAEAFEAAGETDRLEVAAVKVRFGIRADWRLVTPAPGESKLRAGLRALMEARRQREDGEAGEPEVVARGGTWFLIDC